MRDLLIEPVSELLGTLVYLGIAGALAVLGAMAELAGAQDLSAGATTIGLWEAAAGALLLYAAVTVVRSFVVDPLRGDADADTDA